MPHSRDIIGRLRFAAIDFESAGAARGDTDQPVQIGIAACSFLEVEPELWTSYIATDRPVLWSASQVHGITT
ncbi:MAG: 3'-5' exonuclease, partial [Akkermansia sp.]